MMDGRNCTGRKISLLNDSSDVTSSLPAAKIQLPPLSAHSRTSSCVSTPSLSPQTPQLVRSSSSDSRTFATPSPVTPSSHSFDHAAHHPLPTKHAHHHHYYFVNANGAHMDDHNSSMYPPIPDATGALPSAYPMPTQLPPQMTAQAHQPQQPQPSNALPLYRNSTSPSSEPSRVSTVSAASNTKNQPKKSVYPCPMAKQMGCTDFFTTSGHAARHAKKHTGKKDAFCPECNKAFTRKDNMEQHRRTHQNGRGSSRTTTDDAKIKKALKPSAVKKGTAKSDTQQLEAAVEQQLADQAQASRAAVQAIHTQAPILPLDPITEQAMLLNPVPLAGGPYFVSNMDTGPIPALPMAMPDLNMRPPLHRSSIASSLDYVPPVAPMSDIESMHYSYPSPGLSNGLNSLALAASEQRRLNEEKSESSNSPQETPSHETP